MKPGKPLRRLTPMQAKKPLQGGAGLNARKPFVSRPKDRAKRSAATRLRPEPPPDPAYMKRVKALPCMVCQKWGLVQEGPTLAHHLKRNPETGHVLGQGMKAPDRHTIPLCERHHQTGGCGIAIHAGRKPWELAHGNEVKLLRETEATLRDPAAA